MPKFYHARVRNDSGAIVRQRNRALSGSEIGVFVVMETNDIKPAEQVVIDPFFVDRVVSDPGERAELENLFNSTNDGAIVYEVSTERFYSYAGGDFTPYTPVPPVIIGEIVEPPPPPVAGLTLTLSFDEPPPPFDKVSIYWSHDGTVTVSEPWNGLFSKTLTIPFPASMVPGEHSLVTVLDFTEHDPELAVFGAIPVPVADVDAAIVGAVAFTGDNDLAGVSGVLAGVDGFVSTYNDYTDRTAKFTFAAGDPDTQTAIEGFPAAIRLRATIGGVDHFAAWVDRDNPVFMDIPNVPETPTQTAVFALEHFVNGAYEPAADFVAGNATLAPTIRADRKAYNVGTIIFIESGAIHAPTFSGILQGA